jgi:energy-coupling factor transport system permease protein
MIRRRRSGEARPATLDRRPPGGASRSVSAADVSPVWPIWRADATRHLDPRVWLVWLAAVTGPALISRNPFPLAGLLVVVLVVRAAWAPALPRDGGWSFVLRFALVAALISVIFNALSAPFGEQVLVTLPGWWPFGDVVTANALAFGLLSAMAIVVIVLAGTTVGLLADWPQLLGDAPSRFLPLAVASSIAWSFLPQTVATLRDISDAQRVRGLRIASARTILPIVVPLLATSLERATTMAEALESRGFGGPVEPDAQGEQWRRGRSLAPVAVLTLATVAAYLVLDASPRLAILAAAVAVLLLAVTFARRPIDRRSRYRVRAWYRRDTAVLGTALLSLIAFGMTLGLEPDALRYSPYPDIPWPSVSIVHILSLTLLLAPAAVAPLVVSGRSTTREALDSGASTAGSTGDGVGNRPPASQPQNQRRRQRPDRSPVPWASWPPRHRLARCRRHPPGRGRRATQPLVGVGRG